MSGLRNPPWSFSHPTPRSFSVAFFPPSLTHLAYLSVPTSIRLYGADGSHPRIAVSAWRHKAPTRQQPRETCCFHFGLCGAVNYCPSFTTVYSSIAWFCRSPYVDLLAFGTTKFVLIVAGARGNVRRGHENPRPSERPSRHDRPTFFA